MCGELDEQSLDVSRVSLDAVRDTATKFSKIDN